MATHDYDLANQSGASFRSDLNNALQAILTNNSSASAPSTTAAYMFWADTSTGLLKIRNSSNNGWVELLQLDGTLTLEDGSASTPALAFRDDLNTGIFSSAANNLDVACAGGVKLNVSTTGINVTGTVTDDGATHDGDVTFTGAAANVVFDKSDNALEFADNAKATFGADADLTISHDGSNSIINDAGTGELQLQRVGSTVLALDANGVTITDPNGATVVTIKGFEGSDAIIDLIADEGDDNGDKWRISSVSSDNDLVFLNDTSGSNVQKWGINTDGNVVQTGTLTATLGSESAPSYTFAGDDDTGMFRTNGLSNDISFTCAATTRLRMNINAMFPGTTDVYDVGTSTLKFDNVFAVNGTIQTSDQNTKNTITATDLGLDFINKLNPVSYKFNGKTRTHYGLIAQEIETVLGTISKSATDFAGFCKDEVDSEGNSITPI